MANGDISIRLTIPVEDIEKPDVNDVAALLHARTMAGGTEIGTFNANTRPTGDQVLDLIDLSIGDMRSRVGPDIPAEFADQARRLVALQAASLVETSYFPDQLETDRSAYRQYQAMYLSGIDAIINAIEGNTSNQPRAFSIPLLSSTRMGIGCGRLDPFNTNLLP